MDWLDLKEAMGAGPGGGDDGAETGVLLEGLNDPQREAVLHRDGPLLIVAGPGSGKTRVIAARVEYLTGSCGVPPRAVLVLTFSNKAAAELVARVQSRAPGDEVRQQERPHVAHVGVAVHRGAARIQGEVTLALGGDRFDRPRARVVEPHGRHPRWLGAPWQSMAGSLRSALSGD